MRALDGTIDTVIGLPANLFYSTGIPVCILVLKKCKKPDDVLFINAAEHFEKGKRQNQLSPAHIAKIIDTYQFRREEDCYSKRISMERITEEGYNLNISRYISTATAEKEIVLKDTHADLVRIEKDIERLPKSTMNSLKSWACLHCHRLTCFPLRKIERPDNVDAEGALSSIPLSTVLHLVVRFRDFHAETSGGELGIGVLPGLFESGFDLIRFG